MATFFSSLPFTKGVLSTTGGVPFFSYVTFGLALSTFESGDVILGTPKVTVKAVELCTTTC